METLLVKVPLDEYKTRYRWTSPPLELCGHRWTLLACRVPNYENYIGLFWQLADFKQPVSVAPLKIDILHPESGHSMEARMEEQAVFKADDLGWKDFISQQEAEVMYLDERRNLHVRVQLQLEETTVKCSSCTMLNSTANARCNVCDNDLSKALQILRAGKAFQRKQKQFAFVRAPLSPAEEKYRNSLTIGQQVEIWNFPGTYEIGQTTNQEIQIIMTIYREDEAVREPRWFHRQNPVVRTARTPAIEPPTDPSLRKDWRGYRKTLERMSTKETTRSKAWFPEEIAWRKDINAGFQLDARDTDEGLVFLPAEVVQVEGDYLLITYIEWGREWDMWLSRWSNNLQPRGGQVSLDYEKAVKQAELKDKEARLRLRKGDPVTLHVGLNQYTHTQVEKETEEEVAVMFTGPYCEKPRLCWYHKLNPHLHPGHQSSAADLEAWLQLDLREMIRDRQFPALHLDMRRQLKVGEMLYAVDRKLQWKQCIVKVRIGDMAEVRFPEDKSALWYSVWSNNLEFNLYDNLDTSMRPTAGHLLPEPFPISGSERDGGMTLVKCPADNSCFFHAITYACERGPFQGFTKEGCIFMDLHDALRQRLRISQELQSNKALADNLANFGFDVAKLRQQVLDPGYWGGVDPELGIVAELFQTQFVAFEIRGQGGPMAYMRPINKANKFRRRAFLVYSESHYDVLAFEYHASQSSGVRREPRHQTIFAADDELALQLAKRLVSLLHLNATKAARPSQQEVLWLRSSEGEDEVGRAGHEVLKRVLSRSLSNPVESTRKMQKPLFRPRLIKQISLQGGELQAVEEEGSLARSSEKGKTELEKSQTEPKVLGPLQLVQRQHSIQPEHQHWAIGSGPEGQGEPLVRQLSLHDWRVDPSLRPAKIATSNIKEPLGPSGPDAGAATDTKMDTSEDESTVSRTAEAVLSPSIDFQAGHASAVGRVVIESEPRSLEKKKRI